jgi:hypothetical protein
MDSEKLQKVANKFYCECCDYTSFRKSSFEKHLSTDKHKNRENDSKMIVNDSEKLQKVAQYKCLCGKIYKYDSGYYRHIKKCNEQNKDGSSVNLTDEGLIQMLITLCKELKDENKELIEVIKNGTHNTTNSHNNSHNKTFNLQFFLNETCKDAMNIMDFVDSIKLQLSDLEKVGEIGYVEGISNIINKNLKALDVTQRPVHCTDKKREVLYIKDENKWEKENEDKTKIRKAIKHIAHKNTKLIPVFREMHPDCGKSISKYCDQFNKIVIEAMGGHGDNDTEKENKIIANISKHVTIDKETNTLQ